MKEFNPFYDSKILISVEGENENRGRRMLVEMYADELEQLLRETNSALVTISSECGSDCTSKFLVSIEGDETCDRKTLAEMSVPELEQLRNEIDLVLKMHNKRSAIVALGA